MKEILDITSDIAIATGGMLSGMLIYAYFHEEKIIEWEYRHIILPFRRLCRRMRLFIAKSVKSNTRIMEWLNKPQKHGRPDADFIAGQVKVFGDVWK